MPLSIGHLPHCHAGWSRLVLLLPTTARGVRKTLARVERARDDNAIGQAPQTLKFTGLGDIGTTAVGRPPEPGDRGGQAVDTDVRTGGNSPAGRRLFLGIPGILEFRLPIGSSHDITM